MSKMFMKIERAILAELAFSFLLALAAMTMIALLAAIYGPLREGLPLDIIAKLIPYMIPYMLPWTIPTAFVGACITTYSRMAGSNELLVIRAAGIHPWRIVAPAAMLAIFLSAICAVLNHEIVPRTSFAQYGIGKSASASELAAAIRTSDPIMSVGSYRVHVGEILKNDELRRVVIVSDTRTLSEKKTKSKEQVTYIIAPRGRFEYSDIDSEITFFLSNDPKMNTKADPHAGDCIMRRTLNGAEADFEPLYCESATVPIKLKSMDDVKWLPNKGKHLTTSDLIIKADLRLDEIKKGARKRPDTSAMTPAEKSHEKKVYERYMYEPQQWLTEVHTRSAMSLAPILLGMIAVPIGVMTRKGRPVTCFALGIAVVFGGYFPLTAGATTLGSSGMLPPAVAVWLINAIVAVCGVVMARRMFAR